MTQASGRSVALSSSPLMDTYHRSAHVNYTPHSSNARLRAPTDVSPQDKAGHGDRHSYAEGLLLPSSEPFWSQNCVGIPCWSIWFSKHPFSTVQQCGQVSRYLLIPSFLYIKTHNVTMWQTRGSVCFGLLESIRQQMRAEGYRVSR